MSRAHHDDPRPVIGERPVLISIPHDGHELPATVASRMTDAGRRMPDTDWHVSRLYHHRGLADCSRLEARWSRYVVDLNRPRDGRPLYPGQTETALCPTRTFDGGPIYLDGNEPDLVDLSERIEHYWDPYHRAIAAELDRLHTAHGRALLWDAHSIRSEVPRLFAGRLPDFCFGTDGGRTCPPDVIEGLAERVRQAGFTAVVDERFRGGYITRHYAAPERAVHTIQLELSQRTYLDETTLEPLDTELPRVADLISDLVHLAEAELGLRTTEA